MGKNLIPEIAKMFGVEIGEEFKIDINNEIYQIDKNGMYRKKMNDEGQFDMGRSPSLLYQIACW